MDDGIGPVELAPCCCHADHFTAREVELLSEVAAGLSNEEIAAVMHISGHTVAAHVRSMIARSQARSRAELVARAYAAGVLLPGTWPPAWSGRRCLPFGVGAATGSPGSSGVPAATT